MANRGEISREKVKEWERETSKDEKLPEKVKHAYVRGAADALIRLGLKQAGEELRLTLEEKRRRFHGLDRALEKIKQADQGSADELGDLLRGAAPHIPPAAQEASRDPLDRNVAWGAPSNLSAGDTANRISDMGQPTNIGTAF